MSLIRTLLFSLALSLSLMMPALAQTLDLNAATAPELAAALSGIGEKKAAAIVSYRDTIGAFQSVEQLTEVSGIGPKLLESNRDKLSVGTPAAAAPAAAAAPTAAAPAAAVPQATAESTAVVTQ